MHSDYSVFGPYWFAKSVTWNLTARSREVMGPRWCKDKDAQQESSNGSQ